MLENKLETMDIIITGNGKTNLRNEITNPTRRC